LTSGDRVKFFMHPDGSVVLLPKRSASVLRGIVKPRRRRASIEEMKEAASKVISRGKHSLPLCRHRRIVTSISSAGACACQCATLLCDGLAAGYTNVLSELRRPKPDRKVVAFIAAQPLELLYVSAVTLAEIRFGIEVVADATKRAELNDCGAWSRPARCRTVSSYGRRREQHSRTRMDKQGSAPDCA
jgi:hypothetical protein